MGLKQSFLRFVGQRYFEGPAQKLSFREHVDALRTSGAAVSRRLSSVQPTDKYSAAVRHVIGIERWGQRRLRVLLGEPFVLDGHHPYKPADDTPWDKLREEFASTRAETVSLAEQLTDCNATGKVPHNDFGELSARGWLRYLKGHAEVETKRFK